MERFLPAVGLSIRTCLLGFILFGLARTGMADGAAAVWTREEIPDARCGDGKPYSVFIRRGDPKRLVLELKGGGACWSRTTCFGLVPLTNLTLQEHEESTGLDASNPELSPLAGATYVVAPYCTGDVHVGNHEAVYGNRLVHHVGGRNMESLLEHLDADLGFFDGLEEFSLVGRSAGALGALMSLPKVDWRVRDVSSKVLLADSAGMHFGEDFWPKFPEPFRQDLVEHMAGIGIALDVQDGVIAKQMPAFCERHSDWRVGFVQSTLDVIMSIVFGNTSQREHKRTVMGPDGISRLARSPYGSCAVWIQDSGIHTFIGSRDDLAQRSRALTVGDFIRQLYGWSLPISTLP